MSSTIYNITVTNEDFKTTINNAKPYPGLKSDSKSQKMILLRPIQNLDRYESAMVPQLIYMHFLLINRFITIYLFSSS